MLADPGCEREIVPTRNLVGSLGPTSRRVDRASEADADGLDLVAGEVRLGRARIGNAAWIWSRIPACASGRIDAEPLERDQAPLTWPIPSWSLVPPISIPSTQGFSHAISRLRLAVGVDGLLGGEAAVEVVDDPVEDDLVQRFDDPHVVDRGVEVVMGEGLELAAARSR